MRMMASVLATLMLLVSSAVQAEAVAGKDYTVLTNTQPSSGGAKIEVLEFFFYGCSHCYHLHPQLSAWAKKKPKDVNLVYVPVVFRDSWEPMARAYYALESLGKINALHDEFFSAWNELQIDLSDKQKLADFVAHRGVDKTKFEAAYNSFSVQSKLTRGNQLLQAYGVRGTPTLAVAGKYVITGLGPEETINVLNDVIKKARKERGKR